MTERLSDPPHSETRKRPLLAARQAAMGRERQLNVWFPLDSLRARSGHCASQLTRTLVDSETKPSVGEPHLAQEDAPARIVVQGAKQGIDFYLAEPRIALCVGPLEPRERKIPLAARGVHFRDLVG
jgi:hypothetical protein